MFASSLISVSKETKLMGSSFTFTAVANDRKSAEASIELAINEVIRIEKLISSWDPNSETSQINKNAGITPVKVSDETVELISRCIKISELTNGYFDISFASLDKVWDMNKTYNNVLPSAESIEMSIRNIGFQNIEIDKNKSTVFLRKKGMKIGFGGIGKGYAADQAKRIMENQGIKSGVVNAGGDLISWGTKQNGKPWSVGIADPKNKDQVVSWLNITNTSVVTSGNYEKFVKIKGERYCHIIDPKTGWPVKGLQSATIICPNAELADALATTVFVLGAKDGINLINQLNGIECYLIDDEGKAHFSANLKKDYWIERNVNNIE